MLAQDHSEYNDRQPYVAGSFYPANPDDLRNKLIDYFDKSEKKNRGRIRAIISPHAGYIYSGPVAAAAFSCLDTTYSYKRVFIIGASHRYRYKGAALYLNGDYLTPLGRVKVDRDLGNKLIAGGKIFSSYPEAHLEEHSLEVQLPFLQFLYKDNLSIIPVLIGTDSSSQCRSIADELEPWFNSENLFVISSDFSHFPDYDNALKLDSLTMEKILKSGPEEFAGWISNCEKSHKYGAATPMCGWSAGLVLKYLAAGKQDLSFQHISYANSGDAKAGDKNRVVGYHAIALSEVSNDDFTISKEDRLSLLKLARDNIRSRLLEGSFVKLEEKNYSQSLKSQLGAFVTLRTGGKLRGCIGRINASEPLYETIKQMSAAAAFNDSRFDPLTRDELEEVTIEISVLSKMRKIDSIEDIEPGKHGVYLRRGHTSATFLPQVATEQKWNREELLGNLAKNKAGLGWLGWKDADIYIYEAVIFEEENR